MGAHPSLTCCKPTLVQDMVRMTKEITEYLDKQKSPQKEIAKRLRTIILETLPGIKERLWMGVPWYEKFYIVALKDHVNLGFSVGGLSNQEKSLFEGKGQMMRHLRFRRFEDIDESQIAKLLQLVAKKATSC